MSETVLTGTAEALPEKRGITGSTLKLIAIITMFIDHTGAVFFERGVASALHYRYTEWLLITDRLLRGIGRIAFPIFCFLLVEGLLHTSNRKKYLLRLVLFALISEFPADIAFYGRVPYWSYQNVFWTLAIGLGVLMLFEEIQKKQLKKVPQKLLMVLVLLAGMALAMGMNTDYGAFGVAFIAILYLTRNREWKRNLIGCLAISWEVSAPLAFIPIHFYNGKRGWKIKYFFYIFYPAHLLLLWLVTRLCFGV